MLDEVDDKPIKKGQVVRVLIENNGNKGDGVAKIDRYVVFVPNAKVGESLDARVTKVFEKFAVAERV